MELSERAKQARREYYREYRARHRKETAKYKARYWERKAEQFYSRLNGEKTDEKGNNCDE